jgi:hypothetical protein
LLNPEGADSYFCWCSRNNNNNTDVAILARSPDLFFSLSLSRPFEIFFSVTRLCSYFTLDNRTLIWRSESAFLFKEKSEAWRGGGVP